LVDDDIEWEQKQLGMTLHPDETLPTLGGDVFMKAL
jgi:hypothetical protein